MEEKVPYIVYEGTVARFERTVRRLVILIAVAVGLLFASNALWLYAWCQYDYTDVTVDSQDKSNASYMGAGASGVINNGQSSSEAED